jgi:hypothetical protein
MSKVEQPLHQMKSVLNPIGLVLCAVGGLAQASHLWVNSSPVHQDVAVMSLVAYAMAFICFGLAASHKAFPRVASYMVLAVVLITSFARGYHQLRHVYGARSGEYTAYGTDAVAFNHYAAELLIEGKNPYQQSMSGAAERFKVPSRYHTPLASGGKVETLSYPSLSFLVYVPFLAAGLENVNWLHLAAYLLVIVLLFWLSPAWIRAVTPLMFFLEPELVNYPVGGVTDILYVPLLMGAAYFWRSKRSTTAVLWALACCFKQTPWLLAPFLLIALWREHAPLGRRAVLREVAIFFGIAAAVFLLANLPFIAWSAKAWYAGVMTPIGKSLVIYGAGLINLTTAIGIPLSARVYSLLALSMLLTLTVLYAVRYKTFSDAMWFLPAVVYWLAPRSFHSYYLFWAPVFFVSLAWTLDRRLLHATAEGPEEGGEERTQEKTQEPGSIRDRLVRLRVPGRSWVLVLLPIAVFAVIAGRAGCDPRAVSVEMVAAADSTKQLGLVDELELKLKNHTDEPTAVRLAVAWARNNLYFWPMVQGPKTLAAGQTARVRIKAPDYTQAPRAGEVIRIRAYHVKRGKFYLSDPFKPQVSSPLVRNTRFEYWDDGRNQPMSWTRFPPSAVDRKALSRKTVGGRKAVCLTATQTGETEWARSALSQGISVATRTLLFTYRSGAGPVGQALPQQVIGVELAYPKGQTVLLSPNPNVRFPRLYQREKFTFIHLPYKVGRWQRFGINLSDLREFLGYDIPVPVEARIVVSRHRKLRGSVSACVSELRGTTRRIQEALSVRDIPPPPAVVNPELTFGREGAKGPSGWQVEHPQGADSWRVVPRPGGGVGLEVFVNEGAREWSTLTLSQPLVHVPRRLAVNVCTKHATAKLSAPTLLVGVELWQEGATHVFTLAESAGGKPQRVRRGRFRFHGIPRKEGACTKMALDFSKLPIKGKTTFKLLMNVHRSRVGHFVVGFGPLDIPARDVPWQSKLKRR